MQICAILLLREFEHYESLKVVCLQPPMRRYSACLYTKVVLQNYSELIILDCQIFLLRIDSKVHYDFIQKRRKMHTMIHYYPRDAFIQPFQIISFQLCFGQILEKD